MPTLPVLMAQRSDDPADTRLLELLAGDLTDDALHAEALDLLRKHPAMDEARQYVLDRAREAQDLLTALPDGPVKDALDARGNGSAYGIFPVPLPEAYGASVSSPSGQG